MPVRYPYGAVASDMPPPPAHCALSCPLLPASPRPYPRTGRRGRITALPLPLLLLLLLLVAGLTALATDASSPLRHAPPGRSVRLQAVGDPSPQPEPEIRPKVITEAPDASRARRRTIVGTLTRPIARASHAAVTVTGEVLVAATRIPKYAVRKTVDLVTHTVGFMTEAVVRVAATVALTVRAITLDVVDLVRRTAQIFALALWDSIGELLRGIVNVATDLGGTVLSAAVDLAVGLERALLSALAALEATGEPLAQAVVPTARALLLTVRKIAEDCAVGVLGAGGEVATAAARRLPRPPRPSRSSRPSRRTPPPDPLADLDPDTAAPN